MDPAFICPGCGREAFVLRKPVFEGLRKAGEAVICASCGHRLEDDAGPAAAPPPPLFEDVRIPAGPDPFAAEERGRLCRYCRHYVVNPFRQWCGLHRREVDAMDTCESFSPRAEDGEEAP